MTLATDIRFTAPIDPRIVWAKMREILGAPTDYRWDQQRALSSFNNTWPTNDRWAAEPSQGAKALLDMEYGHEGAALTEHWQIGYDSEADALEEYPLDRRPVPGYVQVSVDTPYGYRDDHGGCDELHRRIIEAVQAWSPVPVIYRDEYTDTWHSDPAMLGRVSI